MPKRLHVKKKGNNQAGNNAFILIRYLRLRSHIFLPRYGTPTRWRLSYNPEKPAKSEESRWKPEDPYGKTLSIVPLL